MLLWFKHVSIVLKQWAKTVKCQNAIKIVLLWNIITIYYW